MQSEFIDRLTDDLSHFLGADCEIAIHDFRNGYDATIVKILNGHVTGRTVGCPPTDLLLRKFRRKKIYCPIYRSVSPSWQMDVSLNPVRLFFMTAKGNLQAPYASTWTFPPMLR